MPLDLQTRREQGFRPAEFTARHRVVAVLLGLGKTREEVAQQTGYSLSHVSRIARMPEAREEIVRTSARLAQTLMQDRTAALYAAARLVRERRQV
jgi:DNA-binding NarL/FixJ family response regulator